MGVVELLQDLEFILGHSMDSLDFISFFLRLSVTLELHKLNGAHNFSLVMHGTVNPPKTTFPNRVIKGVSEGKLAKRLSLDEILSANLKQAQIVNLTRPLSHQRKRDSMVY